MSRTFLSVILTGLLACLSLSVSAVSVNVEYINTEQAVPLPNELSEAIDMQGYGLNISHSFSEQWSASFTTQHIEHQGNTADNNFSRDAQQKSYQANLYYLFDNYTLAIAYSDISFDFSSLGENAPRLIYYNYDEDIDSSTFELMLSRDVDFDNFWLSIDGTLSYIDQQAGFTKDTIIIRKGGKETNVNESTRDTNQSWLLAASASWATLWSWRDVAFIPSLSVNYAMVAAGDDVYFRTTKIGRRAATDEQAQSRESFASDSSFYWGSSLTVLLSEQLSCDFQFNRIYTDDSTDNYLSLGLGWEF